MIYFPRPYRRLEKERSTLQADRKHGTGILLVTIVLAIAATGCATQRSTAKGRPRPMSPGPAWADTNHDGYLSDAEYQQAVRKLKARR